MVSDSGPATGGRAKKREETRRAIISEARQRFAENGYARVSLAGIVGSLGLTKGALYHHFDGKEGLFRAVLEDAHREVARSIEAAAPDADAWEQFVRGCEAFLRSSTAPDVQRIMLIDAPSVLGWDEWRALDAATSMRHLEAILDELMRRGTIREQPIGPLVHLLSGAMNEAALWIARSDERERALMETMDVLSDILESLRTR